MVLGAQVEVKQNHAVRRPPALEEVIRSIRGAFVCAFVTVLCVVYRSIGRGVTQHYVIKVT